MKKSVFIIAAFAVAFFSSCKKEELAAAATTLPKTEMVRYQFSSDVSANYSLSLSGDAISYDETINASSWSKEIPASSAAAGSRTAKISVYPPYEWAYTTTLAHVTLKIFVNGVEKGSKSFELYWMDRSPVNSLAISY